MRAELEGFGRRLQRVEEELTKLTEMRTWLKHGLDIRFSDELPKWHCIHMDAKGYCRLWRYREAVKGLKMRKQGDCYALNVKEHRWVCALCPGFEPESLVNKYAKAVRELRESMDAVLKILSKLERVADPALGLPRSLQPIHLQTYARDSMISPCLSSTGFVFQHFFPRPYPQP